MNTDYKLRISRLSERLLASQQGLCSVQLLSFIYREHFCMTA